MKIAICTFAFVASKELLRMVESAHSARHELWIYLSLHSQRHEVVAACELIRQSRRTRYFPYGYNRGLARSLNDAMLTAYADGADIVINCNDDAVWGEGDVDKLAEAAMDQRHCYGVPASGWHSGRPDKDSMGYCVIAFNKICLEHIGCFDENFFPAYFEDVDHHRRTKLAGLPEGRCEQTACYHEGSLSLSLDQEVRIANDTAFRLNQLYWKRKWGLADEYTTPHNLGSADGVAANVGNNHRADPIGRLRIAPEQRRRPYGPGLDRTDLADEPIGALDGQ